MSMQHDLNLQQQTFRLVRIGAIDAKFRTDDFLSLRQSILRSEDSYPGIAKWFEGKVFEGLRSGERTGFLGLLDEKPVAAAIVKQGQTAKFCHLKIDEAARSKSLGDLFFTMMTLDVRQRANSVRFTVPEGVWEQRKNFFHSFSFNSVCRSGRQYRLFETELFSQTQFSELFRASKEKLPAIFGQLAIGDHSLLTGAVLAIQPSPLERIFSGTKKVEIRTRFSSRWEGRKVSLYCTSPVSALAGEARIARVIRGEPDRMWELFGHLAGCTRSEYEAYVGTRPEVHVALLEDVKPFADPIPLEQLSFLLGVKLVAPQSYLSLEGNDDWLAAVALAAALQGSIRTRSDTSAEHQSVAKKGLFQYGT